MRGMRHLLCKRFIREFTIQHFAINSSNPVGTCYSWLGCITENNSNWEAVLHIQHKQMKTHSLGVNKSLLFPPPENVLTKFSGIKDCFSEWGAVPSGVLQSTKLGPWLFILMISDLHTPGYEAWKYVDDTTLAQVVPRGGQSVMQVAVTAVEQWSITNKLQLNPDKCKELLIDFKRTQHQFEAVTVNSKELVRVNSVKVLGVAIVSPLQWNCNISDVIKKSNKRISSYCLSVPKFLLVTSSVPILLVLDLYLNTVLLFTIMHCLII